MQKITVRSFGGWIVGTIEIDEQTGNKTVRDFYGKILGYYKADMDYTTDFYGRVIARGDVASGLIDMNGGK